MKKNVKQKQSSIQDLATWRDLNRRRYELVRSARESGATWEEIERASGITRSQASQWYTRNGEPLPSGNARFAQVTP